jgi:DNA polymerase-3 subunit gamma/tau
VLHAPGAVETGAPDSGHESERMQTAAAHLDVETVQLYYQIALNGRRDLPYAPDEWSGFCMTLLRMLAFAPGGAEMKPGAPGGAGLESGAPGGAGLRPGAPGDAGTGRSTPGAGNSAPGTRAATPAPTRPLAATSAPAVERAAPVAAALAPAAAGSAPATALHAHEPAPRAAWDWLAVVAALRLGGMAKMLADHCELVAQAGDALTLRVGEAHKHLLDRTYQDKLVAALREQHGETIKVSFEIGAAAEQTPQQVRTRIREARQAEAVAAIESDPFVRELVESFGGQIDANSIQPTGDTAP